ncbi:beta-ketoacyl synthase N-terminal-like domain-containing protein [Cronbergia sp. UHCC 0137]|uniref:type I polyketide synthase n=1 Tax=Cronbergia sp. UHCC 0137 TaxID=3110239 RepID=UPI002B1FE206|nr:beta-ketoacyl synthase N-terminal-like domain-containing protein [Cronbergia sp. UHCC 0137]MEA5620137.1 beta-ketoacyl synthase N-terminal-like domain-containing protein [Cronbergia sp. UHCC 0137]
MNQEAIAIIGLSGRFPKAENIESFQELVKNGVDAITNSSRNSSQSSSSIWGGFLENIDQFAADFFKISPQEAAMLDPQHRLLLEIAWEALEDAGQVPQNLAGSRTGVFVGIGSNDYSRLISNQGIEHLNVSTGNQGGMIANRISYFFDFRGISISVDTACSSALVAVDRACHSLWTRESTLALVGGVNLILMENGTEKFENAGLLAADNRCKVFDARADGYVRGEGVGMVVLKPLSQAQADRDRVYAIIKGSAINNNGRSNSLTAPNLQAQVELLQQAYQNAGVDPATICYIETHATGTPIGDALELKAIGKVLGKQRSADNPCRVGSVKTNIGHTEAASGMAGLIKVILSLRHRQLFPTLHFQQPNPAVEFEKLGLRVQQTLEPLLQTEKPLRMGVSAFGFGGTNTHVILEEAPLPLPIHPIAAPFHLLTLSAQTDTALQTLVKLYLVWLSQNPDIDLGNVCYSANVGRSRFQYSLFTIASSLKQLQENLENFLQSPTTSKVWTQKVSKRQREINTLSVIQNITTITQPHEISSLAESNALLWHKILTKLGHLWLENKNIDWNLIYSADHYRLISLPSYPFERQSCWFQSTVNVSIPSKIRNLSLQESPPVLDSEYLITGTFVPPRNGIEQQLTAIWEQVLNVKPIGVKDNFFDLGGNSSATVSLIAKVETILGKTLPITALFELMTIADLAHYLENENISDNPPIKEANNTPPSHANTPKYQLSQEQERSLLAITVGRQGEQLHPYSFMVKIQSGDNLKKPFFYCANSYNEALPLANCLEYPFYLLESGYTVFGGDNAYSIKALAARHLEDILKVQPHGSYSIGGYSYGTFVAYEISQQLQAQGKTVDLLVIFDRPGTHFLYLLYNYWQNLLSNSSWILSNFKKSNKEKRLDYLRQKGLRILRRLGLVQTSSQPVSSKEGESDLESISSPSLYQFSPYDARVVLFYGVEGKKIPLWLFSRNGWSREILPKLEIYKVPGNHHTMIQFPHVTVLARQLNTCLGIELERGH